MSCLTKFWRQHSIGYKGIQYLDDGAWACKSLADWWVTAKLVVITLQSCGFWLGLDKCILFPRQEIEMIGFMVNSDVMVVYLPDKRIQKVKQQANQMLEAGKVTVKDFRSICGQIIACDLVCWGCRVFLRELYASVKAFAFIDPVAAKKQPIWLTHSQKWELRFWINHIGNSQKPIMFKVTALEIWTDASDFGFGGFWRGKQFAGLFTLWESLQSSTFREMRGFELLWEMLKQGLWYHIVNNPAHIAFPAALPIIRVYTDNQGMACVMKWGSRVKIISQVAKRLWSEALTQLFI